MRNKLMIFMGFLLTIMPKTGNCQQEPQWLLPIYFETGDGQKDTVYIGYDPSASPLDHTVDPQFFDYEHFVYPDLDKFNAYVEGSLYYGEGNSVMKASIKSQLESHIYINFIGTGTSPITMKWDYLKLYSEDLPDVYTSIPSRPRARIDVYPEVGGSCYPGCIDDCYYICVDSLYSEMSDYMSWDCHGIFADSLFVSCEIVQSADQVLSLAIAIRRFNELDSWWSEYQIEPEDNQITFYPNPTSGLLIIQGLNNFGLESIEIYDCIGKKLDIKICIIKNNNELDLSSLKNGVYFIKLTSNNIVKFEKIFLVN